MRKKSGFTVLEVLIVITIMAVMMGFGIPYILGWLPNYRLRSAARDVHSNLQLARITAVKEHVNCTVSFTKTGGVIDGYIIYLDADNSRTLDTANETMVKPPVTFPGNPNYAESPNYNDVNFDNGNPGDTNGSPDGVNFNDNGDGQPSVTFLPNGLILIGGGAGAGNGTVYLRNNKGRTKTVVVNRSGRIRTD